MSSTQSPVSFGADIRNEDIVLGERVGHGSYGEVFKGRCRGFEVAIKKPKPPKSQSKLTPAQLANVRKEVEFMRSVHPSLLHMCQFSPLAHHDPSIALCTTQIFANLWVLV